MRIEVQASMTAPSPGHCLPQLRQSYQEQPLLLLGQSVMPLLQA